MPGDTPLIGTVAVEMESEHDGPTRHETGRRIAVELLERGYHPLPLPAGKKYPPPAGFTGYHGGEITADNLDRWDWSGNMAVRIPDGVVGIDIDVYNGGTVDDLEAEHGPLPATIWSTSRDDGSGIAMFRIPAGVQLNPNPTVGVDIIQRHHRYAVTAPSIHPNGGRYRWVDETAGVDLELPPPVDELPELPWSWINALRVDTERTGTAAVAATRSDVAAFLERHTDHRHPGRLQRIADRLADVQPGERHDALVDVACWSMREAAAGSYPAADAAELLARWWRGVMDDPARRDGPELADAIAWAVGQVNANPDRVAELADPFAGITAQTPPSTPATKERRGLALVDWSTIRNGGEPPLLEGLAFPGRWTAISAAAKQGKSEYVLNMVVHLVNGRDPYTRRPQPPVTALYLDAEMGSLDMVERLDALEIPDTERQRFLYTDHVPKLDRPDGADLLLETVDAYGAQLVVIDGVNGAVSGAENDDTPWRDLFDATIQPLKRRGVAVISCDNLGKDRSRGPRGSSVKLDKPDAVLILSRTADGIRLRADQRRTAAYPTDQHFTVDGVDGTRPITYTPTVTSWPAGTADAAAVLDDLGVDVEVGRVIARRALTAARDAAPTPADADRFRMSDPVLSAAITYRRRRLDHLVGGGE